MSRARKIVLVALVALVGACAGRNFARPQPDAFTLGVTSYDDVLGRFGKPYRQGSMTSNGIQLKTLAYAYAEGGRSLAGAITPARTLGFYFRDGLLVGSEYTSTFPGDSTDFDGSHVSEIEEGVTSRAQVIGSFGPPGGEYMYPLIDGERDHALVYWYHQTRGTAFNLRMSSKQLIVSYDEAGVVTNVKFTSSGQ